MPTQPTDGLTGGEIEEETDATRDITRVVALMLQEGEHARAANVAKMGFVFMPL